MRIIIALLSGILFGLGLAISGMVNPTKVLNFFDVFGSFDASLALVMAGALPVTFIGYRLALKRHAPIFADRFRVPTSKELDGRLIWGSALFGLGWGLSGFCPGPAIARAPWAPPGGDGNKPPFSTPGGAGGAGGG